MLLKPTFPVYCAIRPLIHIEAGFLPGVFALSVFHSPIQSISNRMLRWAIGHIIDLQLSVS